ncbi:MAG: hypothetical protein HZB13_01135 [Acidobacteria bacterium]|nr:hypothetical protein [Acidobacteriota bacterium]
MERTSSNWSNAAAAALAAVFALHVWRAATAAITTDEAFTFTAFVAPPLLQVLTSYDANHHVLHSLLCKLTVALLGAGEFTLRLPALLGAAIYLTGCRRLALASFGATPLMAATCLLLAVHSGLIDYFSLARGYSLAMGFLVWGLVLSNEEQWERASLCFGRAVASNPVFVIPAAAAIVAALRVQRAWRQADRLIVPGAVAALVVLALPLSRATAGNFYLGYDTPWKSLRSLLIFPHQAGASAVLRVLSPLLLVVGMWLERGVYSLMFGLCVVLVTALHEWAGMPWPYGRTGIYFLPVSILLAAFVARRFRWATLLLVGVAVISLVTVRPQVYTEWESEADSRQVMETLRQLHARPRVAASQPMQFGLEFYRATMKLETWPPVVEFTEGVDADFYVISPGQPRKGLRVLRRFPRSGVEILAR